MTYAAILLPTLACASAPGAALPWWSVLPFAVMLLAVALLPLLVPHFWEHHRHRALVSLVCGAPVLLAMLYLDPISVAHTAREYAAFVLLLGSLYVITSGIVVRGGLVGTPWVNTCVLLCGSVLASLIGTTGASMLLIRPLLGANAWRVRQAHIVVFFIFLVSNIGGLLTPLGDPPLFLGFLRGVPFTWTLQLWPMWLMATLFLAGVFYLVDSLQFRREPTRPTRGAPARLTLVGRRNIVCLAALIALIMAAGHYHFAPGWQELGMLVLGFVAWRTTPAALRDENRFSWAPMQEVAIIFAGIFASMMPALSLLNVHGASLGLREPWQFFWVTGLLSSFLDNAPTYLTFTATASSLFGTDAQDLGTLLAAAGGARILTAISLGAVMMGANTYIGNGPNFMVKAVAEDHGVKMPNFFGYLGYSTVILMPLFLLVTWLFVR